MLILALARTVVASLVGTGLLEALGLHLYHTGLYLTARSYEVRGG